MTINYTTLLGLAKPVTGTESGAWGDVVNDQITSLVEDAIANAASISVTSGNVTLTDNNGSSDQSRMAILLVTGSPGVSRNIVAPSTSKWYIVKNSSNAEIVLKGSATTGVTIPAGAEALAFWNGSDFELAAMIGPSSSTDNAVARFDGTTGKVVQNSAVTIADTTGDITTGGYVFTAAGAAGTPAYSTSGDTNTGMWFPAADTIAFSEGGTEGMRLNSSGNLGIGTSSPGVRVDASGQVRALEAGSGSGNGGLIGSTASADGNAGVLFQTNSASRWNLTTVGTAGANLRVYNYALGSTVATFDSSGNLGVGVTSPTQKLDVNGGIIITGAATLGTGQGSNLLSYESPNMRCYVGDGSGYSWRFSKRASSTTTDLVTITDGGDLGIGTTSPVAKLQVAAGSSPSRGIAAVFVASTTGAQIQFTQSGVDDWAIGQPAGTSAFAFWSGRATTSDGTERVRITSGGDLLVGTTNASASAGLGAKVIANANGAYFASVTDSTTNVAHTTYNYYSTGAGNYRFYVGAAGTVFAVSTTISGISDQRLKENIQDIDVGLDKIMALKPRKFDWKPGKGKDKRGDRGWIAQEFEQVFPEMIDTWKDPAPEGEEPYKAVNADLIPVLVKAIQELKTELDSVKAELTALKGA